MACMSLYGKGKVEDAPDGVDACALRDLHNQAHVGVVVHVLAARQGTENPFSAIRWHWFALLTLGNHPAQVSHRRCESESMTDLHELVRHADVLRVRANVLWRGHGHHRDLRRGKPDDAADSGLGPPCKPGSWRVFEGLAVLCRTQPAGVQFQHPDAVHHPSFKHPRCLNRLPSCLAHA